jgi:hypothetical protein
VMANLPRGAAHAHKTALAPLLAGLLRDKLRRKVKIKIAGFHFQEDEYLNVPPPREL